MSDCERTPCGLRQLHALIKTPAASSLTTSYEYDKLSRLTCVNAPGQAEDTKYFYEPTGNRSDRIRNVANICTQTSATPTYSYDKADRIQSVAGVSYTVNANGNLTAKGSDSFAYDQANRMTSATVAGKASSFTYDGDGRRATQTVAGVTTSYIHDVAGGLPMVLEDGARKYVYGAGLAYTVAGSSLQVYHTDGLGSVRAITDSLGAVVEAYRTDEFGAPYETKGKLNQPM